MPTMNAATSTPSASVLTTLYTVTAGKNLAGNLTCCNRGTSAVTIRVAMNYGSGDIYREYDFPLQPSGSGQNVYYLSNIKVKAGTLIKIWATGASTDWTLDYAEETAA